MRAPLTEECVTAALHCSDTDNLAGSINLPAFVTAAYGILFLAVLTAQCMAAPPRTLG